MKQLSFPLSRLGGYLCPCKLTWPCPSGGGRSRQCHPMALPWCAASSRLGMGGELCRIKASCDIFLASRLENGTQTINVTAGRCPLHPSGEVKIFHGLGWVLNPFCPRACNHSSSGWLPVPQLDTDLLGRGRDLGGGSRVPEMCRVCAGRLPHCLPSACPCPAACSWVLAGPHSAGWVEEPPESLSLPALWYCEADLQGCEILVGQWCSHQKLFWSQNSLERALLA